MVSEATLLSGLSHCVFFFRHVFFDFQVVDDKLLALWGVLAHVEGEHVFNSHTLCYDDWVETDVFTDKVLKLIGGDFAQAFEASDLGLGLALFHRGAALLVGIAVAGHLLVAHAEERRL